MSGKQTKLFHSAHSAHSLPFSYHLVAQRSPASPPYIIISYHSHIFPQVTVYLKNTQPVNAPHLPLFLPPHPPTPDTSLHKRW